MENKRNAAGFVASVISRVNQDDSAFRAAMSRADNPTLESCAWEYLVPFCNIEFESDRQAFAIVGAAIAKNRPEQDTEFSFGRSLASICENDDDKEREGRRLRRLVSCSDVAELLPVIRPILNYLAAKGAKIGYHKLLNDLLFWNKKTQLRWVNDFYGKTISDEEATD